MKQIKLLLVLLILLLFSGCVEYVSPSNKDNKVIDIYSLNDLHGAIEKEGDYLGLSYISNYINKKREENPNTLLLAAGDMYQGGFISNYYNGLATVEIMNTMNFDAMVIGNHEFDWTIDEILKYHDGNLENGEANYPLLAANIVFKGTNKKLPNTKDYVIVTKDDVKIGIIGTIGYGMESEILEENVTNYEFLKPQDVIKEISYDLRQNKDCDVVIALTHDNGDSTNIALSELPKESMVDAIFNAHYHQKTSGSIYRGNGMIDLPYIQAGSYGQYIGKISLTLNSKNEVIDYEINHINNDIDLTKKDQNTEEVVAKYLEQLGDVIKAPLASIKYNLTRPKVAMWTADVIMNAYGADIGFQNKGGIKANAFNSGTDKGDSITLEKVFQILPHDNTVMYCKIKGRDLKNFIYSNYDYGYFSSNVSVIDNNIYINNELLENDKYYVFVTNDYIFTDTYNPFMKQDEITKTGVLVRDLMIEEIKLQNSTYGYFDIYEDILIHD